MDVRLERDTELQREMLAGNRGHCSDYKHTNVFGHAREPFTWLSVDGQEDDHQLLVTELLAIQRSRGVARFEAWEVEDESWRIVHSGEVHVIYVELDARLAKVRALLQWVVPASA